jgi:hypothetical protein
MRPTFAPVMALVVASLCTREDIAAAADSNNSVLLLQKACDGGLAVGCSLLKECK